MKDLKIPKFTKDPTLRRLRWLMVCVILVDTLNTLLGQPVSYSQDPATAQEFNKFMAFFVRLGSFSFVGTSLLYVAGWFLLVSVLPRKLAYVLLFAVVLGHYFGASTWLVYHWGLGMQATVIYAVVISIGFGFCGIPQQTRQAAEAEVK